ncbi:MAG: P1 family peptidase [Defluviimonas sp.]|uniref:DmpA family aminopeptidase n=1 Tax=Albidovulum sp. TaxID=1872424 RepID=UPI001E0D1068|nr:P1 family peptidase [Paracoccaceae bacterium]MCC0064305.1 P1 family peptidase [Defluviimonas sp.]
MTDPFRTPSGKPRARALGLAFPGSPGPLNAITDVPGVAVGYTTLVSGSGPLEVGRGPVRTGVTAILPRPRAHLTQPVFAGISSFNGNGEMSGSHWIDEAGRFALPITITNTHSCGLTRDATLKWAAARYPNTFADSFGLPVAAETYDGYLNDINGFHVQDAHVFAAIDTATTGAIEEGSVGGGTGMICFGFKAGSGTASRRVGFDGTEYTVGIFVQANFGYRDDLTVAGQRLGARLHAEAAAGAPATDQELSSIIAVVATDAPFLPHQMKRLARRPAIGMGRVGGYGRHGSGDIFIAFSTANAAATDDDAKGLQSARFVPDNQIDPFFEAVVQAMEEAILNSMIANEAMTGRDGNHIPALPRSGLQRALGL